MKTSIYSIFAAGALLMGAASCSDGWGPHAGTDGDKGTIDFGAFSISAPDADKTETVVNSTASRASIDLSGFLITVVNIDGVEDEIVQTWTYSQMPEILTLPVGKYRIDVESHKVQKAEWERPYYAGSSAPFEVTAGKITNAGVVSCKFASLKVSVRFEPELLAALGDDVKVTIFANDEGTLEFSKNETRSGFFEVVPGSTTLAAHFEGSVDGKFTTEQTAFEDIEAGQHRIITYKAKGTTGIPDHTGTITPGISLDADVTNIDIAGNVTVTEDVIEDDPQRPWGPEGGGDGPDNPDQPENPDQPGDKAVSFDVDKDQCPNLSITSPNILTEENADNFGNAIVNITAPKGFKNLVVKIVTTSEDFKKTLDGMLPLEFDLANAGEYTEALAGLSLPVNEQLTADGVTNAPFDITMFISLLAPFKGQHDFVLTVTDKELKAETMTLTFIAQ